MSEHLVVTFDILSYWRCATGAARASELDAVCARDVDGLPFIPGRQVRGILKEAVRQLGEVDPRFADRATALFGGPGFVEHERERGGEVEVVLEPIVASQEGCLAVDSARLPAPERALFAPGGGSREERALATDIRAELFTALSSTKIDDRDGVAHERTLRREEVALPMRLEARVTAIGEAGDWRAVLGEAALLIEGIGAKRTRGLGRVVVSCAGEAGHE